ncbi:DNA-binding protein [Rhodococcus sp. PAMC28707]|uniref:bifunctional MaoC family dehydratase N-terminal/OB-fold nucleic acid binding domain-containing protein n=1 Tax=unclassified Rhodococcus (in: high G+C Gram-positive bacteria) TaxID=192944 RepID=UPI00109DFD3C|nr:MULTISPECIES: MaoC family dehydratase N-terminal domain-containing protein [unclassified Rhodococcus (in: high G+C Gram-positive bacteria)]QCB49105.1 DNA-binding protein [Rhodococcus sp. PAMC28705]QCB59207.1 DNA-binding protein [Rhodococcus sp. PAMC28707]
MSESISEAADRIAAAGECAPRAGRDPINQPMINNWVEAIGDANPIYVDAGAARAAGHQGVVAPPAMAQVWTMGGLHYTRSSDDPLGLMMGILDDAGFTSVVATNCDQTYHRYLELGEEVTVTTKLDNVVGPKKTGLGLGWFVTTRNIWYVGDEAVAEMVFRVLKFAPEAKPVAEDVSEAIRPVVSQETEFFWEGARVGELRIQRVEDGSLRHPPIPAIWQDKTEPIDYVVARGTGTVFSFVVHHAPKVPGRTLPFVVALVELDEGVRVLGELRGIEPSEVEVGLPVEVEFLRIDENFTLPAWKAIR